MSKRHGTIGWSTAVALVLVLPIVTSGAWAPTRAAGAAPAMMAGPGAGHQTYWGPGDPRNENAFWLKVYQTEFASLIAGGRLVAGWFGAPLGTSHFFQSQLHHWWDGTGAPIDVPANNPVAEELHDDPFVQGYFSQLDDSGWARAVNTWVAGQAAVIPCGTTGTTAKDGVISYQQTREGVGLIFKQFDGIYGVGKPWKAEMQTHVLIKRYADGSLTYSASGEAKIYKAWGWPTDPYSTWNDYDLNFKAWYLEYYGGAKAFPLTMDLGSFSWSGEIPAGKTGECNAANPKTPAYGTPIDLGSGDTSGKATISQNGKYIAVEGATNGGVELLTDGGPANGGTEVYTGLEHSGWGGVNDSGEVDGYASTCGAPSVFVNGSLTPLTPSSGTTPQACSIGSISNNGNVVGGGYNDSQGYVQAWLYKAKERTFTTLKPFSNVTDGNSIGMAVNNSGTVAGEAFYNYIDQVVGFANALWKGGIAKPAKIGPEPLKNGFVPSPEAINNRGLIVGEGYYSNPNGPNDDDRAFESIGGAGYVDLGALVESPYLEACDQSGCFGCGNKGGTWSQSEAFAVNSTGVIVGASTLPNTHFALGNTICGYDHAVIWPAGSDKPIDLNKTIPANSGWLLTKATGVADNGNVVGQGTYNGATQMFLLTGPEKLSGTVRFADGASPTSTTISITPSAGGSTTTVHPDANGNWQVELNAAGYNVTLKNVPTGYVVEGSPTLPVNLLRGPEVVNMSVTPGKPKCAADPGTYPDGCSTEGFHEPKRETGLFDATTAMLPAAKSGAAYRAPLSATGGTKPYKWTEAGGTTLPPGLHLGSDGTVSGTAKSSAVGSTFVTVQVADDSNPVETAYATLDLAVTAPGTTVTGQSAATTAKGQTQTAVGGAHTATPDTIATGSGGDGTLTTMTYSGDPEKVAPPLTAASTRYFAIGASPGSTFATIAVTSCGPTRGPSLDWFDVSSHTWKPVTPAPKTVPGPSAKTCLLFSAQGKSKPAIHQLENLQLAMGAKKK